MSCILSYLNNITSDFSGVIISTESPWSLPSCPSNNYKYRGKHQTTLDLILSLAKKAGYIASDSRACSNKRSQVNKYSSDKQQ